MSGCFGLGYVRKLHGVLLYWQKPIGNYIVDFYAPVTKLVTEVMAYNIESTFTLEWLLL